MNRTTEIRGGEEGKRSLMELFKEKAPIWVRNNSAKMLGEPVYVFLRLGDEHRSVKVDPIPPGDEPVCLTDKVPHKFLEECSDLFRLVDKGILEVVSPDEAEAYYRENPGKREVVRQKIRSLIEASESGGARFQQMIGRTVMRQAPGAAVSGGSFEVSPRVKWLASAYKAGVLSREAFKVELSALADALTEVDKDYLRTQVKDDGIFS
jgi:hypothetical protein